MCTLPAMPFRALNPTRTVTRTLSSCGGSLSLTLLLSKLPGTGTAPWANRGYFTTYVNLGSNNLASNHNKLVWRAYGSQMMRANFAAFLQAAMRQERLTQNSRRGSLRRGSLGDKKKNREARQGCPTPSHMTTKPVYRREHN